MALRDFPSFGMTVSKACNSECLSSGDCFYDTEKMEILKIQNKWPRGTAYILHDFLSLSSRFTGTLSEDLVKIIFQRVSTAWTLSLKTV